MTPRNLPMPGGLVAAGALCAAALMPAGLSAQDNAPYPQPPAEIMENANFLLGFYNVEDLLQIPGTDWIIGGGIMCFGAGLCDKVITKNYLHVFDAKAETGQRVLAEDIAVLPDGDRYPVTTPPDFEAFGPHGIAFGEQVGETIEFFVVGHDARESIEAFVIDYSGDYPKFIWRGAVIAQEDFWPDAVAVLPDGGFVATATQNPQQTQEEGLKLTLAGEPVGATRLWHPDRGWETLPGSENFSTPNGILASPDGQQVFVAASTDAALHRIDRSAEPPELTTVDLDGVPDNCRWANDEVTVLCGIHTPKTLMDFENAEVAAAEVGGNLLVSFKVLRVNTETMEVVETVLPSALYGVFGGGTGAIEVGDRLWVSSTKSDRIGIFDLP